GARFVRDQASAYRRPDGLLTHWCDTSEAAARAVGAHDPAQRVATQEQVMTVCSLERTLVLEAVVHHLDCLLELPSAPRPGVGPSAVARETFSALAGTELPEGEQWLLRAAGRLRLTDHDRSLLGAAADRFPLLA
ncbi:MAG: maleylpyruvate isomerase N-terminal domain-containing protein, partial [Mycobacteriales bacterium]